MSTSQDQLARMLTLVPYLQARNGIPVKQVADDFGVTTRQIIKDLNVLWFCGLPGAVTGEMIDIDMEALEADGVVHIENAEFLTRPLRLHPAEAMALIVALRTLRASSTPSQGEIIDTVTAKLESVVGEQGPPVDVHVEEADPEIQDVLVAAVASGTQVEIDYATPSRDELTTRTIEPLRLFAAQGRLFVDAYCLRADDRRTFRLDRITRAVGSEVPALPRDVAPASISDGLFTVSEDSAWAVLDLEPNAFWLTEYYETEELDAPAEGIRRVRLYGSDTEWLRRLVMRNGGAVTVVAPQELAEEVVSLSTRALAAYDGGVG